MKYSVFSAYSRGYAHVRENMPCQDYAAHYRDEEGRFAIAVACDGHSDKNCFRSDRGARFGCEAAIEVLKSFLGSYCTEDEETRRRNLESEDWIESRTERIKRYFIREWKQRVDDDLKKDAFTDGDLVPLSQRVRDLYKAGQHTRDIYGATLQACAVCEDFHLVMQIGDGVILALYPDGCYDEPLQEDEKGACGQPASICDGDLLDRLDAFRITIVPGIPVGMFATSDGMGDIARLMLLSALRNVQEKIAVPDDPEDGLKEIGESQQAYIQDMVAYYADKDHGPEDDCSIAGFVLRDAEVAPVSLKKKEAEEIVTGIDQRLKEEENRISAVDQNRKDYLRKYRIRISELESRRDRLKADLEAIEKEQEQLLQKVAEVEGRSEEKEQKALDTLREQRKKAEAYLLNSRTGAGRPIPHGVLADRMTEEPTDGETADPKDSHSLLQYPAEDLPVERTKDVQLQDRTEEAEPADVKNERGSVPATELAEAATEDKAQEPAGNDKPDEKEPEGDEPDAEEEDPHAFDFPVKIGGVGQAEDPETLPVQQPVIQQPVQPPVVQPPVIQQPVHQPVQRTSEPIPRMDIPPKEADPKNHPGGPQWSASHSVPNMYVVPEEDLLLP